MTASDPTVFDEIRSACAEVAARAGQVRIDPDRLRAYAQELDLDAPDDDPGHVRVGDDEATAAFVMTLDAVNFGSGWFPYLTKRPGLSGYHTVAEGLHEHVAVDGPPTSAWLRSVTTGDCARIFGQTLDGGLVEELMGHFTVALNDLGGWVDRHGGGTFVRAVEAAGGSAARLVDHLLEMPYYQDVHDYDGLRVPLLKRAQITVHDLAVTFDHEGPGHFPDHGALTMFADNLVPHVLRVDGVLRFDDELVDRIVAVDDIACGSPAEVEIRASAVHAVELLVAELRTRRPDLTAGTLDGVLWRRGAAPAYKSVPRHRSRCVFY